MDRLTPLIRARCQTGMETQYRSVGRPGQSNRRISKAGATGLTVASYLTGRFLWRYNKSAVAAAQPAEATTSASSTRPAPQSRCGDGVALSLLPTFVHVGAPKVTAAECAVFHDPCITTWLRVNTCVRFARRPCRPSRSTQFAPAD
jgi:hypothetical protein